MPDGRSFQFRYNSYGELARVVLPTGGAIEYDYAAGISSDHASGVIERSGYGGTTKQIYRRVVERRVYPNGVSLEGKMTYANSEDTDSTLGYVTSVTADHLDASSTRKAREKHYFYGWASSSFFQSPLGYPNWKESREYQTDAIDPVGGTTVLRRSANNWQQGCALSQWALDTNTPNNPRIADVTATLTDTNQVSKQTFSYDCYNNKTDIYEYDYGSGAPPTYATRHSHTDYLTTNSVNSINYAGPIGSVYTASDYHIRNLPSKQIVYSVNTSSGAETKVAQTEFEYDKYDTSTYHANLVARSGISGLDSTYASTSTVARGNVTMVTRYANAAALTGAIYTYQQCDVAGNVVVAIDARGKSTTFDYSDRYGAPSGEARANSATTCP